MNLKNYFIEELGVSSGCWEKNEAEIREIVRDSIYSFTKWLYGYEKYDREDFKEVEAVMNFSIFSNIPSQT